MSTQPCSAAHGKPSPCKYERRSTHCPPFALTITGLLLPFLLASCAPARSSDPVAVVQAAYDRLNEDDIDGYMEFLSDDAVLVDGAGRYAGAEAIRADMELNVVPGKHRFELSDLRSDGNVVTYTVKISEGDPLHLVATDEGVAVVVDGLIIFDGGAPYFSMECNRDASQAFCPDG